MNREDLGGERGEARPGRRKAMGGGGVYIGHSGDWMAGLGLGDASGQQTCSQPQPT